MDRRGQEQKQGPRSRQAPRALSAQLATSCCCGKDGLRPAQGKGIVQGVPTGMGLSTSGTALFSSFAGGFWGRVVTVPVEQLHC